MVQNRSVVRQVPGTEWAGTGPTAAYACTVPGVYAVTLTATNPCGQARGSLTVTVVGSRAQ